MFKNKEESKFKVNNLHIISPPPPNEVVKVYDMLKQVEHWINKGDKELSKKHWQMIADECIKYSK